MSQPSWTLSGSVGSPAAQPAARAPAPQASPAAGAGDPVVETTTQAFARDVLEASRNVPVMVDFWADWCGPCKQLTPVLEKVVRAAKGKVKLVKMNIDRYPEIAGQLGIQSIPAVIAFRNGRPLDGFMGNIPESQVVAFVQRLLGAGGAAAGGGPDVAAVLAEAETKLGAGELDVAAELFATAVELDPESPKGYAGLARVQVAAGDLDGARETLAAVPPETAGDAAIAAAQSAIELAEQAARLGDPRVLEARIAADPLDHQARIELAMILSTQGRREAAVDALVESVRRDRTWNEEAARKQLLQFFEAWGPKDKATLYGRRRLSSVLFS